MDVWDIIYKAGENIRLLWDCLIFPLLNARRIRPWTIMEDSNELTIFDANLCQDASNNAELKEQVNWTAFIYHIRNRILW